MYNKLSFVTFTTQISFHSELGIGSKRWVPTKFPHFFGLTVQ